MTVETKPNLPAVITPTGEPWSPKTTEILASYPEAKFNQLLPTQQVRQVNPFLVPDIEVVQLSEDDIYHSNDMKSGQFAPTAKGLAKLAQVAGITMLDSRRMDAGRDPDAVEWRVEVEMTTPSGRTIRGFGSKEINLTRDAKGWSAERKAKAREHLHQMAETKAFNRAIRALLSLHGSYPKPQLLKPFAVLRYVPDMSQPEVRQAFLGQLLPASTALYGPANGEQPKQLESSEPIVADEAPEDDPAPERPANVDADGAVADEEPDWGASTATESAEPPMPRILINLRERAEASESKGAPTPAQREQLKVATRGLGAANVMAVLRGVWQLDAPADITRPQADAILDEFEQRGATFGNEWREAATFLAEGQAS
jgi:hypothetical protein